MRRLRGRVSGLCQPGYVLDIPGGYGKVPVGPDYLDGDAVEDWRGHWHALAPAADTPDPTADGACDGTPSER
jgi:lysine 2,3-aminomutase